MTEIACKNCHFYCPSENKGDWDRWDGECRRNPPNNGFPGVNEDFWCGEFKSKIWVDGNGFPIKGLQNQEIFLQIPKRITNGGDNGRLI